MATIKQILQFTDEKVINILKANNIKIDTSNVVNKLVLLKLLCIYLPLEDKELLYSKNFDSVFIRNSGILQREELPIAKHLKFIYTIINVNEHYISLEDFNEENLKLANYNMDDLYLVANMRNIDIIQAPSIIHKEILKQLPTIDWLINNLRAISNLEDKYLKLIDEYVEGDYVTMNKVLRENPSNIAELNTAIQFTDPLDKDIIVYRYIEDISFIKKTFISYGYLSTSLNPYVFFNFLDPTEKNYMKDMLYMMKIHIPRGAKAIYVSTVTLELIFPHKIELVLKSTYIKQCILPDKSIKEITYYEIDMII